MIRRVALFLVLAILLTGCAGQRPSRYSRMYYDAFDTVIQLTVYAQAEPDFSAFEAELWRLDAVFDRYAEHPGICGLWALNASGGGLEIEPELYELLTLCKQWWEKYGDRVNPGMGGSHFPVGGVSGGRRRRALGSRAFSGCGTFGFFSLNFRRGARA